MTPRLNFADPPNNRQLCGGSSHQTHAVTLQQRIQKSGTEYITGTCFNCGQPVQARPPHDMYWSLAQYIITEEDDPW